MGKKIKNLFTEFGLLLKSVPPLFTILFVMSVIAMNILANKSLNIPVEWLALDCGIMVSWFAFLVLDVITKHFGPRAAAMLTVFAILINLLFCLFLFLGSVIPGSWGESFGSDSAAEINTALDRTFGGTWYVILGSTVAFLLSSTVNDISNWGIGKLFKKNPNGAVAFLMRAYISTAIGQFLDNLLFALIVSHVFFGWSIVQCLTCAATGMIAELLLEVAFSYFGLAICKKWNSAGVGAEYFSFMSARGENSIMNTEEVSE